MKRVSSHELLDEDAGSPSEIAESIADLHNINRRFGGISTTLRMLENIADRSGKNDFSLLDVGSGNGDLPATVQADLLTRGIKLHVTLLDRVYSHLGNGAPAVVGDALKLPFADDSFDVVTCNLFVHHLSPEEVVSFVQESLRCCRMAVAINDLIRSSLHLAFVYAGLPLFHSRITRNDAPASVRQAYTPEEIRKLISKTGAARVDITKHYLYRMGVLIWKRNPDTKGTA
jgi:ubiquinone/menaquinone biosynthesis C-methylase UbiE